MDDPFIADNQRLTPPAEFEATLRRSLPPSQLHIGADDYVDYSWHAPAVRVFTMRPALRAPDDASNIRHGAATRWADCRRRSIRACSSAAKTIGGDVPRPARRIPQILEAAKAEFHERTGGGVGGSKWVAPLLPRDFIPPVDLRWPEYITTARGEEWWIPTPNSPAPVLGRS